MCIGHVTTTRERTLQIAKGKKHIVKHRRIFTLHTSKTNIYNIEHSACNYTVDDGKSLFPLLLGFHMCFLNIELLNNHRQVIMFRVSNVYEDDQIEKTF